MWLKISTKQSSLSKNTGQQCGPSTSPGKEEKKKDKQKNIKIAKYTVEGALKRQESK